MPCSVTLKVLEATRFVLQREVPHSRGDITYSTTKQADAYITVLATIFECYRVIQAANGDDVLKTFDPSDLISPVRPYLSSVDIHDQAYFITCLSCIDPLIWAGVVPERPLALDALEVERVVQLMAISDSTIRSQVSCIT